MQSTFAVPKRLTKQVKKLACENGLNFSQISLVSWKSVNVTVAGKVKDYNTFSGRLQKLLEVEENEN